MLNRFTKTTCRVRGVVFAGFLAGILPLPFAKAAVQAVVASSTAPYASSTSFGYVNKVVVDPFGNVFMTDSSNGGALWEVPAGTSTPVRITNFVLYGTVTNAGSGYSSAPTVTFSGGGGSGATAVAVLGTTSTNMGTVTGITMTNQGSGYTSNPTVTLTGGGGAGATATANIGINSPHGVTVDKYGDVIYTNGSSGNLYFLPNKNGKLCTTCNAAGVEPLDLTGTYGFSTLDDYYTIVADIAIDNSGNLYVAVSHCNNNGNACGASQDSIFLLKNVTNATTAASIGLAANSASLFLGALPGGKAALNIAVDNNGHLFYVDGTNAYVVSTATAGGTPVTIGSFTAPSGVSVDSQGNLYIVDNNKKLLYEIPNENGTLNPADQFVVAALTNGYYSAGFDAAGNIYAADGTDKVINKITLGGLNLTPTAVGTPSATGVMNYRFNGTFTASAIALLQGAGGSGEFTKTAASTCAAGTAYTVGQSCQITVTAMPSSTGIRTGAIALLGATNKSLSTSYLSVTGTGPGLTVDPGTQTTLNGSKAWVSPTAVAFDASGNVYAADSGTNTVQFIPVGGGTGTAIGSGLQGPAGVAVDGAGNVYIADTGNNRLVEVPNENGTLNTADQAVLVSTGLNAPTGVAIDQAGAIYLSDTGNKRVLRYSTFDGLGSLIQTTVGSGYQKPLGLTTDNAGNVYVADSVAGQIDEVNVMSGVQTAALTNVIAPTSIAFDAGGSFYIASSSAGTVERVPLVGGLPNASYQLSLGNNLATPIGVAVNGAGSVLVADPGTPATYLLQRAAGTVNFGQVNIGLSSSAQTVTLTSAGSSPVTLGTPAYTVTGSSTADYSVTSPNSGGCTGGEVIALGATCTISAVLTPIVASGTLTATITFSSNAVNASPLTSTLTGVATNLSLTTTALTQLSPANGANPVYGQAVTVQAAVSSQRTGYTPTGTVSFLVDGQPLKGKVALSTTAPYTASVTLAGLYLTAGSHAINACYSGDSNNAASCATTALQVLVTKQPSTVALSVYPFVAQTANSTFTFTATVSPTNGGSPSGTVSLNLVGGSANPLISGTLVNGTVTLSYPIAAPSTYQVAYSGDANYLGSTSSGAAVTISPPGYTLTLPATSYAVKAGQSVTIPVLITGISGYAGNVTVGGIDVVAHTTTAPCVGLPTYAMCTFSPGIVSLSPSPFPASNPTGTINVTIATSVPPSGPYPSSSSTRALLLWPGGVMGLTALALVNRRRRKARALRLLTLTLFGLLGATMLGVSGCGSGSSSSYPTPTGTSTITLTFSGTPLAGTLPVGTPPTVPDITNTTSIQLTVQ